MTLASLNLTGPKGPGLLRSARAWWEPWPLLQAALILLALGLLWLFAGNVAASMARIGISPGSSFLDRSAKFESGEAAIAFRAGDGGAGGQSAAGPADALVRRAGAQHAAAAPAVFWMSLAQALPPPRQALVAFDAVYLSDRGVFTPGRVLRPMTAGAGSTGLGLWAALGWSGGGVDWRTPALQGIKIRGG